MLILPRTTRRSALPLATMALNVSLVGYLGEEDSEEVPPQTLPQTPPIVPEILPQTELPQPMEMVGRPTWEGMGQGSSLRQEDLAVQVDSLTSATLVRCASSPNHQGGRSSGSCHWRSWECWPSPGSGVCVSRKIHSSSLCCYGG